MSLRLRLLLLGGVAMAPALALVFTTASASRPAWVGVPVESLAAVAVVLGLGLTWLGAELLVLRSVRELTGEVGRPATGQAVAHPARARAPVELARLVRGIDELTQLARGRQVLLERSEAGRRAAEARLAGILDVETDAIIRLSQARRVTLFNRGAERIFGWTAAEATNLPLERLLPVAEDDGRAPLCDLADAHGSLEVVGQRKDGGRFPAQVGVSAHARDGQTSYTLVLRDVTEEKRAEEALRESEARFRGAFEHSAAGMALQDTDGRFVRVNRALCGMLGYAEQDLLTMTHQAVRHPDDPEPEGWYERDLLGGSIRWYQREQRYRHRLGHVVWGLLSVSLVRAGDGRPLYFLVQVHDITERKRAEELEGQLRQAQKIEAIGQLAAGVAHDFNNLLMVITGRSQILRYYLRADDPVRRHVELILTTAVRAGALTRQLLAFSRKQELRPRVLDPNAVMTGMIPMLRRLLGEHVGLVTRPAEGLGRVKADRGQLEQILLNLAVNARDAMPQGGRITLETANVDLDEAFVQEHPGSRVGAYTALTVRDTGVGMDAATRARVFEPFFTTKGPGKGTGLGLATVYGIVKQGGGYIGVESESGQGATFTVYLPRVDEAVEPEEPIEMVPPIEEIPRGSETILLVEDEEAVRDLAREVLQHAGYTVLGAAHGGAALVLSDGHSGPIHVLVTDVVMPEMGGHELATRLAASRPEIKVVYMSGYTDEDLAEHGVLGPATALLRKPLTADALVRKVREVLNGPEGAA